MLAPVNLDIKQRRKSGDMTMADTRIIVFLALMLLPAPWSLATEVVTPETEIRAAVASFGSAFMEADIPTLESLLEERYTHINGGSGNVLNRDEWLRWVESRRAELESGALVVSDYWIENVEVEVHGEAAAVTGVAVAIGSRNGIPYDSQVRFTNLWVHRGDSWRRAAFHDSPLLEKSR